MFAIAFDLVVRDTSLNHPKGVSQAYSDIGDCLKQFGFDWVQGSLYITTNDDLSNLFRAISALKALSWFPNSVRDIRVFKVEHWSDFTLFVKEP